jgi:thiosulfate/3-mercaptopyruvate sulfurtransferase
MQKWKTSYRLLLLFLVFLISKVSSAQNPQNWTNEQLIKPAQLAKLIETGSNIPVLISVGPGASIPHSIAIGSVNQKENLAALDSTLQGLDKNAAIVVYCGCCPYEHCPNVRPAIALLKEYRFTNYKLLDLPHNIKADWLDKGYPRVKE